MEPDALPSGLMGFGTTTVAAAPRRSQSEVNVKHHSFLVALLGVAILNSVAHSQAPAGGQGRVVVLDPALDAVMSRNARIERLKTDYFGIAEGTVWVRAGQTGYLLFSDIAANVVYKWTPDGALSVFLERAGYTGTDTANVGNIAFNGRLNVATFGSNGLALDSEGRLILCAQGDRAIVRMEKDGTRTILADRYQGMRLNGPNDLALKSDGSVYFTDPGSGLRGGRASQLRELTFNGVFRAKNGQVQLVDREPQGSSPNGLAFSPDEKYLYVNGGGKLTRYEVQPDGSVANGRLFIDLTTANLTGGTDGMKVDPDGNVFTTGPGGVWVITPSGKPIGRIELPEGRLTNLAFGDADGKTLYIVTQPSLYRVRLK